MNKKQYFMIFIIIIIGIAIIPIVNTVFKNIVNNGDRVVQLSMAGFTPNTIHLKAGEATTIKLVNLDNSFHEDGGGWHQFASDDLNFDYNVKPKGTMTITLKIDTKGVYSFYCDVCCGGKESQSMQGKIIVE